ncbi:MAG TPA: hypothetical protein VGL59_06580 [Polyangia bacterium]|jgi:hypothetical protein
MARRPQSSKRLRQSDDVAVICGRTDDQEGFQILRRRAKDQPVEMGTLRPLREGKNIDGEVISLKPRADYPFVCDVKVELASPNPERAGVEDAPSGPAQVASEDYRRGWDAVWGHRTGRAEKVN